MAGGRIKGITIELNGDSTKLEASLKSVSTEVRNAETKLRDLNKLLKLDPGNTNLLSQKYKTLRTEIAATKEKMNTLKEAAKQADQPAKSPASRRSFTASMERATSNAWERTQGSVRQRAATPRISRDCLPRTRVPGEPPRGDHEQGTLERSEGKKRGSEDSRRNR